MTRARGLHATRSRVPSDIDTSSLPERRIERRFFLFRWHRARARAHDTGNVSPDSDLHRPVAWFPGAYDLRGLSWAHGRVWGLGAAGQLAAITPGASRPPGLPGVWSLQAYDQSLVVRVRGAGGRSESEPRADSRQARRRPRGRESRSEPSVWRPRPATLPVRL